MRSVKVTYGNGTEINTTMSAELTDSEIRKYFKIGKLFNLGRLKDNLQPVKKVEILK